MTTSEKIGLDEHLTGAWLEQSEMSEKHLNSSSPNMDMEPPATGLETSGEEALPFEKIQDASNVCDECGKRFTRKSNLVQHKKFVHEKYKPFRCEKCELHFAQKSDLAIHLMNHPVVRVYACEQCEKSISRKNELNDHQKSHRHPKNYLCNKCDESFTKKMELKFHLKGHRSQLKKYSCDKCVETFSRKSDLFNHLRLKHADLELRLNNVSLPPPPLLNANIKESSTSALNMFETIRYTPVEQGTWIDFMIAFEKIRPHLHYRLLEELQKKRGLKWYIVIDAMVRRFTNEGETETATPHFRSKVAFELSEDSIFQHMEEAFAKIQKSFEEFTQRGSEWTLERITRLQLDVVTYNPLWRT